MNETKKPRSIITTDNEWEYIKKAAKQERQSITQYIVKATIDKATNDLSIEK